MSYIVSWERWVEDVHSADSSLNMSSLSLGYISAGIIQIIILQNVLVIFTLLYFVGGGLNFNMKNTAKKIFIIL